MVNIINELFITIFLQIRNDMSVLSPIERVVSMKEAADILEIPERTLRSRMNNGEFDEEKGDFRRISSSIMIFDREAIENRKFMKKEIYWQLKEMYKNNDGNKPNQKVLVPYSEINDTLQKILKEVKNNKA